MKPGPTEHGRYASGFRVYRLIELCKVRAYTERELSARLNVHPKTIGRMIRYLESQNIPFYQSADKRWRILQ